MDTPCMWTWLGRTPDLIRLPYHTGRKKSWTPPRLQARTVSMLLPGTGPALPCVCHGYYHLPHLRFHPAFYLPVLLPKDTTAHPTMPHHGQTDRQPSPPGSYLRCHAMLLVPPPSLLPIRLPTPYLPPLLHFPPPTLGHYNVSSSPTMPAMCCCTVACFFTIFPAPNHHPTARTYGWDSSPTTASGTSYPN